MDLKQKPTSSRPKQAQANLDALQRIFTIPESDASTLSRIEKQISENLMDFLKNHVVAGETAPAQLERDFMDTKIPENPVFVSEQADFLLSKVVAQSVHVSSPTFVGHMTSALPYFMLSLSKIMTALNQNVVKIETSKAFTPLEKQTIGMLHRLVYKYESDFYAAHAQHRSESLGVFCSGGTIANVTGLWVARNRMLGPREGFAGVSEAGLPAALRHYGYDDLGIVMSRRAHYSFKKSADLLGIGKQNLIVVDTDEDNKIDIASARAAIVEAKRKKIGIMAIIGVAGTTETGNVDPLDQLADLAKENKTFFHVDAAWGGPTLFSNKYSPLLKGIERADCVCIDAHKQLYVPVGIGVALFRKPEYMKAIENHAQYVIRKGSRDLGKHTLEGSRPGMAMLVHSGLRIIGRRGYELLIDQGIEKAKAFADLIKSTDDFELVSEPELNLLTYRYVPPKMRDSLIKASPSEVEKINKQLNKLTEDIQKAQRTAGKTFVSRTTLEPIKYGRMPIRVFRVVLANPLTTFEILRDILEEQREISRVILSKAKDL